LNDRRIPFVFTTGYDVKALPPGFQERPYLTKPFQIEQLSQALHAACRDAR
jgi:CheY-like chemotaxis protein